MISIADAYDYLQGRGVPRHVAAGIVGNLQQESGSGDMLNPNALNAKEGAYGIAQWRFDRRAGLERFAAGQGKSASDGYVQLDYILHEMDTTETSAGSAVRSAGTVEEAAALFDRLYERSAGAHLDRRTANSQRIMGLAPTGAGNLGASIVDGTGDTSGLAQGNPSYFSAIDEYEAEKKREAEAPGLWTIVTDAWNDNTATAFAARQIGRSLEDSPLEDPNFTLDDKPTFDRLTAGLPRMYHDTFSQAVSMEHALALRERAIEEFEADQRVAAAGWGGVAAALGTSLLDPVAIGATLATEGLAAPVIYGAKIGRASRAVRAGLVGGGTNLALDAYMASQRPEGWTMKDALLSATTGFVFGAATGALRHGPSTIDTDLAGAARRVAAANGLPAAAGRSESTLGAKFVGEQDAFAQLTSEFANAPEAALGAARVDATGRGMVLAGGSGLARDLIEGLGENAVGNKDHALVRISAEEKVEADFRAWDAAWKAVLQPNLDKWLKANKASWFDYGATERYMDLVGRAARLDNLDLELDPHVRAAASAWKSTAAKLLQWGKEHGVKGFDTIRPSDTYVTRRWNLKAIDALGENTATRLIADAIMDGTRMAARQAAGEATEEATELLQEEALAISKALITSIRRQRFGDFEVAQGFSGADTKLMRQMLEDGHGIDPDVINNIIGKFEAKPRDADGKLSAAKRRVNLDENYRARIGSSGEEIGIADLLDNNIDRLATGYMRQLFGAGHMQQYLRRYAYTSGAGEEVIPSFAQVRDIAMRDIKGDPTSYLNKLDYLHDVVVGRNVSGKASPAWEYARLLRNFNFIRLMGQAGVAQLTEIGGVLSAGGLRTTVANVPTLRSFFKRAANGQLEDDFAREMEAVFAPGTDYMRNIPGVGADDYGTYNTAATDKRWFRKADFVLQRGTQITSTISGMRHIDAGLKRLNYAVILNRFAQDAKAGKRLTRNRLHALGLTEEMADRIQEQLRQHVKWADGNKRVRLIDWEKWTDGDAASAFRYAVDRYARRTVQENSRGAMPQLASSHLSKIFLQFRSFMLGAYTKLMLAGFHQRDWQFFSMVAWSSFIGSMTYTGQTYVNSIGAPDQDTILKERLTLTEIGKAGFQRTGVASVAPMLIDMGLGFTGVDPLFQYGRTTGLTTGLFGNPTLDLFDTAQRVARNTMRAATDDDYDLSQRNLADIGSLMPFKSAFLFRNMLAALGSTLPEDNR